MGRTASFTVNAVILQTSARILCHDQQAQAKVKEEVQDLWKEQQRTQCSK